MISVGIDAGSRAIKIVLLDVEKREVLAEGTTEQGVKQEALACRLLDQLLSDGNLEGARISRTVATGYGRNMIRSADETVTEITCHAVGVRHLLPDTRTIIEIGGQDSKMIRLDPQRGVRDFAMNDRCAAGTGRFLEVVATRLGVELDELGEMAARSENAALISSMCVVFAETEIIGLLGAGVEPDDIVAGVQAAIASRLSAMVGRRIEEPIVFTGGVALVPGMDAALSKVLGRPVSRAPHPLTTGALGAALLAARG